MAAWFSGRITVIWLFLVSATLLSFGMGHGLGIRDHRYASAAILIVAFIKVRFVILDFMELRHAPSVLRIVAELWVVLAATALVTLFWLGTDPAAQANWPHINGL
ncbi:cytochrome C oxidase subunit IV family protein [Acidocella sp. KAb 2-4]|uniref:cytochrome C oxidase subunit IV family protein n=1 Tax=Acidocella sp. KAb 2-4 TaxID=2885158 RepID=UPI001D07B2F9|nr:cytochrome C oxidase subunit IV family protein [Acidocella sp. KAb 2-4]MCB5945558.1 cytochrome C oxidase subunit IV family protein [Acidocella sp. KAb 2-4]